MVFEACKMSNLVNASHWPRRMRFQPPYRSPLDTLLGAFVLVTVCRQQLEERLPMEV